MTNSGVLKINDSDNVATLLRDFKKGEILNIENSNMNQEISIIEDIDAGFKVAVTEIKKGNDIVKYGEIIGSAIKDISQGEKVHVHNVEGKRGRGDIQSEGGEN